jgi:hypothetical protein
MLRPMQTNTTTITDIETAVERHLAIWNEPDAATRTELARTAWSSDGRLVDPLVDAVGPDAIAAAIGELQQQMPGHSITRATAIDAHHDLARFSWTANAPDGTVAIVGLDVLTLAADGRIQTSIGFFGDLESNRESVA